MGMFFSRVLHEEEFVKKAFAAIIVFLFLGTGNVLAKDLSLEIMGGYATEPDEQYGTTTGFGAGTSISLDSFIPLQQGTVLHQYGKDIKFRADVHSYRWNDTVSGIDIEYRKVPVFLGGRYFFPFESLNWAGWDVYGEGGLEVSFDRNDTVLQGSPVVVIEDRDINVGASVGGGILFHFTEMIVAGIGGRFHAIRDPYATADIVLGVYLPY